MIHDAIPKKYQKYPFITILKHGNVVAKVNKLHCGHLDIVTPYENYGNKIHVTSMTPMYISHEQKKVKY